MPTFRHRVRARSRSRALNAAMLTATPGVSDYRVLRAAFYTTLAALFERTATPVRDIARLAGVSDRAIYRFARQLGCRPRRPGVRYRGRGVGGRRRRSAPQPLDAEGAQRVLALFQKVVRSLREQHETRRAAERKRASDRAQRRAAQAAHHIVLIRARALRAEAAALERSAVARAREERRAKVAAGWNPTQQWWQDKREARLKLEQKLAWQIAVHDRKAREAAERAAAARPAPPPAIVEPALDPEVARRVNAIAEQYDAREQERGPRIRSWD